MRFIVILALLFLAACGGSPATPAPEATATSNVPPTEIPPTGVPVSTGESPLAELQGTIVVPEPGTLVVPSNLNTPDAPTAIPVTIDQLGFTQVGGINDTSLTIILHGDGTLIRDGQTSTVSQAQVQSIASLLDSIHFFELEGIFTGGQTSADTYRYTLVVVSGGRSRTVNSQDGLTPPELNQVYDAIRALGNS